MRLLLYSGILYIIIIAIVLAIQPQFMFTADGCWKEFGIGRNSERYTWLPFWLFAIITAILCYIFVLLVAGNGSLPGVSVVHETIVEPEQISQIISRKNISESISPSKKLSRSTEMKSGYYILNAEETAKKGIPKYIYLGPEPPNLVFSQGNEMVDTE